jgi:hypothetical protein
MNKYSLEVENWGEWEVEKDFSSMDRAKRHGLEHFSQNQWRIFDRTAGEIVYTHNPSAVLEEIARQEVSRFNTTDHWRTVFAERAAREVVANQQRERMVEIASRQREIQRVQEQRRRDRLRGFRFVGSEPEILRQRPILDWFDAIEEDRGKRPKGDKVNWLKEGF